MLQQPSPAFPGLVVFYCQYYDDDNVLFLCVYEAHSFRGLYKTNFVAYKAFCTYLQLGLPSPPQKLQVLFVFNML